MQNHGSQMSFLDVSPKEKKIHWLSHTAIEGINRCPRCFWLAQIKKIRQPEGIQSRLASRFDIVLKQYFNAYRKKGEVPPLVAGKLEGTLQDPFKEKYFHKINEKYGFWGKLDECLVRDGEFIPVDFKTSSSDPRGKEVLDAYQHQIDAYAFLIQADGKTVAGYGYLIFFYPDLSEEVHNGFPMITEIKKVEAHPENVLKRIEKAIDCLEHKMPDSSPDCVFCNWFNTVKKFY